LRDLVALGQVRVEVVLAREHRRLVHRAAERERGADGVIDGRSIDDGKRARHAKAYRADMGVRLGAVRGAAAAEDLRTGQHMGVNFKADDGLECHARGPAASTSAVTPLSKVLKLSANIRASFAACTSYSAGFDQVRRGFNTSDGTPGHVVGTSRLN